MIRLLRLFLWLKWRELANRMRFARRTDQAEQLSRVAGIGVGIVISLLAAGAMAGIASAAFAAGSHLGAAEVPPRGLILVVELFMAVALGTMIVLVPVGASEGGGGAGAARFLLLPIPRGRLHLLELLSGISNIWVLLIAAGTAAMAAGIFSSGRAGAALLCAAGGLLLLVIAVAWGGLLGFLTEWLFRDRGRGETILLVLMGVMLLVTAVLPLFDEGPMGEESERRRPEDAFDLVLSPGERSMPPWLGWLPSGLYARVIEGSLEGRTPAVAAGLVGMALHAWLLLLASSRLHARLLDRPSGGRRRRVGERAWRIPALPGLTPAAAAVAQVQVRTALRTVRGKVAVFFAGAFILGQALVLRGIADEEFLMRYILDDGAALALGASLLALLSLQPIMFNQLASDGDGLSLQYLAPITDRDLLMGKAAGCGMLLALAMAPCLVVAIVLTPGTPVVRWLAVPLAVGSIFALLVPLAAFLSMVFPRHADLSKLGSAGNAHPLAGIIAFFAIVAAALPPVAINGFIGTALGSPGAALALMAAWAALCVGFAIPLLTGAARLATERRENLGLVARGK